MPGALPQRTNVESMEDCGQTMIHPVGPTGAASVTYAAPLTDSIRPTVIESDTDGCVRLTAPPLAQPCGTTPFDEDRRLPTRHGPFLGACGRSGHCVTRHIDLHQFPTPGNRVLALSLQAYDGVSNGEIATKCRSFGRRW